MGHALLVFHSHRLSFIDLDYDIPLISKLGIKHIRVPISWCLTDHDPSDIEEKNTTPEYIAELKEKYTCQDPYYPNDVMWPAGKVQYII